MPILIRLKPAAPVGFRELRKNRFAGGTGLLSGAGDTSGHAIVFSGSPKRRSYWCGEDTNAECLTAETPAHRRGNGGERRACENGPEGLAEGRQIRESESQRRAVQPTRRHLSIHAAEQRIMTESTIAKN